MKNNETEIIILLTLLALLHNTMWQNWINALLGIIIIAIAFLGLTGAALGWTLGVIGVIIAIVGFWGATALSSETPESTRKHA